MHSASLLSYTAVRDGGSRGGAVFVVMWSSVGTVGALSMNTVFGMASSSTVMTWHFTPLTVNDPVVRDSDLLYCVEALLSSAT